MIENLTKADKVMLGGAAAMAAGAFLPIVKLPIVGTLNYFLNGQGNGVVVVIIAAAVTIATIYEYRRSSAVMAAAALLMMAYSLVGFISLMAKMRADQSLQGNPFRGLADALVSSIGLEWGWVPMIGGSLAIIIGGLAGSGGITVPIAMRSAPSASDDTFSAEKADEAISRYLAARSTAATPSAQPVSFGKRR